MSFVPFWRGKKDIFEDSVKTTYEWRYNNEQKEQRTGARQ